MVGSKLVRVWGYAPIQLHRDLLYSRDLPYARDMVRHCSGVR
jgi:hypothetical protein